jgi:signal transduction histidine kinase
VAGGTPGLPGMVVPNHRNRSFLGRARAARRRAAEPPPAHGGWSKLRVSNWRVRTKLIAAVVIPTLAFLVMAGAQAASLVAASTAATEFAAQVELAPRISTLVDRLQDERDRTVGQLAARTAHGGPQGDPTKIDKALAPYREATDREIQAYTAALHDLPRGDATWSAARARADRALASVAGLRNLSGAAAVPDRAVFEGYRSTIEAFIGLMAQTAEESANEGAPAAATAARVTAVVELTRAKEATSQLRARLYGAAVTGEFGPTDLVDLTDLRSARVAALADFRAAATKDQILRYDAIAGASSFKSANTLTDQAVARAGGTVGLDAEQWWAASSGQQQQLRGLAVGLLDDAVTAARAHRDAQLRRTLLVSGAIAAVLLVALLTSYAISRSMNRSLRLLRGQALQVAQLQLPELILRLRQLQPDDRPDIAMPISSLRSLDEIGEVAEAFAAVHRSAVELAIEQAIMRRNVNSMFVNLARRSQVLVERQLELLDDLEREESDPDQLGDLFKLDHLAARMRRNAENLLVLAGSESIRRWSEPVELPVVTLAAIAEIEQYPRVRHDVTDQLYVVGHVVADLVHLLAELLENATSFSPPDSTVRVTGSPYTHGTGFIEITDMGMGMAERALQQANDMLASPPAVDVAASERMGLFVVSHLAARHGVRVFLRAAERGLVASVWLPSTLLAPPPIRALPGARGARPMIAAVAAGTHPSPPDAHRIDVASPASVGTMAGPDVTVVSEPDAAAEDIAAGAGELVRPGRSALRRPDRRSALTRPTGGSGSRPAEAGSWPAEAGSGGTPADLAGIWFSRPTAGGATRPAPAAWAAPTAPQAPPAKPAPSVKPTPAATPAPAAPPAPGEPAAPTAAAGPERAGVVAGTNASGLPVRVPMAQLPGARQEQSAGPRPAAAPNGQVSRPDPDPDAVGSTLSQFYAGVRRAEAEETAQTSAVPAGPRTEEDQQ